MACPKTRFASDTTGSGHWSPTPLRGATRATVYDNSQLKGPRIVAQLTEGFLVGSTAWPDWTPRELAERWPTP